MSRAKPDPETEGLDRLRRIETRLTQLCVHHGVGVKSQKPEFDPLHQHINIPSMHSSLQEILDSIPKACHEPIGVCINGKLVLTIDQSPP